MTAPDFREWEGYDRGQAEADQRSEFYAQASDEEATEQARSEGWRSGGRRG